MFFIFLLLLSPVFLLSKNPSLSSKFSVRATAQKLVINCTLSFHINDFHIIAKGFHHLNEGIINNTIFLFDDMVHILAGSIYLFCNLHLSFPGLDTFHFYSNFDIVFNHVAIFHADSQNTLIEIHYSTIVNLATTAKRPANHHSQQSVL